MSPSSPNRSHPGPIATVGDVVLALDSPSASVAELMDCVTIARSSGDLRLARLAAEQAFGQLAAGDRPESSALRQAASTVVRIYVAQADSEHRLPRQLRRAKAWLDRQRPVLDEVAGPEYADDEMKLLSEVQALLSATDARGLETLGTRLIQLGRSDLVVEVVGSTAEAARFPLV